MSFWLSRPFLIDHKSCAIAMPSLCLEESDNPPGPPSPFTPTQLQYQLHLTLSSKYDGDPQDWKNMLTILEEVDHWLKLFPKTYTVTEPNTFWDKDFPYVQLQGEHLHTMS
ncbi:uncharacterized protein Z519_04429 [Cladophialophora bantiana CBS 173.52]|uniref:Uncharacterized protein n=1 Tax=Cladophialophora bantiana (strain ATCC 10958 / CBS 173.52 / CDC B-1940 / NIH 8579) TaxID=1442370 RepID=A0A0D2HMA1_CLAB1|nr:uncharacterized protein Z519_04429 [Cladophialophora bantiana CBS 173.52]KIW94453.1 hypothetical protein Z519_04429 [Cladophialophora bantiana CBS 173.52]